MVRDPDLRAGRSRRARARQSAVQDQSRLLLSARPSDSAADLRSRPNQGADEAHQPAKGPRRRSEMGARHLGRGARHRRRQDDRAAQDQRGAQVAYIRGRYSSTSTELLYGALPKIYGTGNYFSHSAICAEAEKMGPGLTQGFFGYRDYDLAKMKCLVAWGPIRSPPTAWCRTPSTLRRDPRARHGHRRRSAAVQRRREGARMAADQAGHRRCAGGRARPCGADRRAVEQGVRRRLQGGQEPVRRRQDRRRGRLCRRRRPSAWSSGGTSN